MSTKASKQPRKPRRSGARAAPSSWEESFWEDKVRREGKGGTWGNCNIEHSSKLSELFVLSYFYLYSENQLDCNFEPLFQGNVSVLVL